MCTSHGDSITALPCQPLLIELLLVQTILLSYGYTLGLVYSEFVSSICEAVTTDLTLKLTTLLIFTFRANVAFLRQEMNFYCNLF